MFAVKRIVLQHHGHPMISSVASRPQNKKSYGNESEDDEDETSDEDITSDEENGSDEDDNNNNDAGTVDNIFEELLSE